MNSAQWSPNGEMTRKADNAIMALIATAGLPFCFVEEPGFLNLLKILAPNYNLRFFINNKS